MTDRAVRSVGLRPAVAGEEYAVRLFSHPRYSFFLQTPPMSPNAGPPSEAGTHV